MAIALDNSASTSKSSGVAPSSVTVAYVINTSGANLYVAVFLKSGTATISSVTYNGVAMTALGAAQNTGGVGSRVYWLGNVTASSANIVATFSTASLYGVLAYSFTGAANAAPEVVGQTTGTTAAPTQTVSTLTPGDVLLDAVALSTGSSSFTATSSQTSTGLIMSTGTTATSAGGGYRFVTTATSYTDAYSVSVSQAWAHTMLAIQPPSLVVPNSNFFLFF